MWLQEDNRNFLLSDRNDCETAHHRHPVQRRSRPRVDMALCIYPSPQISRDSLREMFEEGEALIQSAT